MMFNQSKILSDKQISALRLALLNRLFVVCFGAGVDSTAMLVALHECDLKPDAITFANTGGEKKATMLHVDRMNKVLASWGWPQIDVCVKKTLPTTPYDDLYGNCISNETLPSLAFGLKSCSIKYKQGPQDYFLKGIKSGPFKHPPHPLWERATLTGQRLVKLIGYDSGPADMRRSKRPPPADAEFDYLYILQLLGWSRPECVRAITDALGAEMVPIKSACFYCPASKIWELYWLAAHEPDLLERALVMERNALTGRHSRFDEVEFGASWEELVRNSDRFPSTKTCVGLGRSFSWNQWARTNSVCDENFTVLRTEDAKQRFIAMSQSLQKVDNALDGRSVRTPEPVPQVMHFVPKTDLLALID